MYFFHYTFFLAKILDWVLRLIKREIEFLLNHIPAHFIDLGLGDLIDFKILFVKHV
jgi:hypothetical protein